MLAACRLAVVDGGSFGDVAHSLFTGAIAVALCGAVLSTWIGSGLSFVRPRSKD